VAAFCFYSKKTVRELHSKKAKRLLIDLRKGILMSRLLAQFKLNPACGSDPRRNVAASVLALLLSTAAFAANPEAGSPASPDSRTETVIVFIGDSLTQGYGVRSEESYPELVGDRLRKRGYKVKIINGGISGSVTAEADRRLRWYLKAKPQILVLALGANDGMKGSPPEVIESNLRKAIDLAKANNIEVVLGGLKMFTNLGDDYLRKYEAVFPRLSKSTGATLIPFLLEDVALQKEYNQSDMRHPNPKGHEIIADRVTAVLEATMSKKLGLVPVLPTKSQNK
jgi:acyl-CoA thioesterase-1